MDIPVELNLTHHNLASFCFEDQAQQKLGIEFCDSYSFSPTKKLLYVFIFREVLYVSINLPT